MSFRGLLCVALLAIPCLAQQSASPAAPAQRLAAPSTPPASTPPMTEVQLPCVPAYRAAELLDKHGCVVGKVFQVTSQHNGSTHISLCPPKSGCSFLAVVPASDHQRIGDLFYLHGRLVAFIGDITNYRGHPEIVVNDRNQMKVAAGDPPPQFDAAQPKPSSSGQPSRGKRGRAW